MQLFKLASMAAALFSATGVYADVWANFCDDRDCSVNCGEGVDVTNDGCLGELGRGSILFGTSGFPEREGYSLKFFSDGTCSNEVECDADMVPADGCISLDGQPYADSFQFVSGC